MRLEIAKRVSNRRIAETKMRSGGEDDGRDKNEEKGMEERRGREKERKKDEGAK